MSRSSETPSRAEIRFEPAGGQWDICTPLTTVGALRRVRGGWELIHLSRWVGEWREFRPGPASELSADVREWAVSQLLLALYEAAEREWVRQHPPGAVTYVSGGRP